VSDETTPPPPDLKERLKALTQPLVDSLDARVKKQIDSHVDAVLDERIAAALADRLAVIERAIADLDRALKDLREQLAAG
jgi:predicted DNA-binding protein